MTALRTSRPALVPLAPAVTMCLVGLTLLLARPWLARRAGDPTAMLIVVFVSIGVVGAWWTVPAEHAPRARGVVTSAMVTAVGVATFAVGRGTLGGDAAVSASLGWVALNTLAAIAEEAFFRRLVYGLLAPHGAAVAVVGSAALFALVHVTVWGAWVLPLDFAAGLVLAWQRWASGRWSVPAVTHAAANLLALH